MPEHAHFQRAARVEALLVAADAVPAGANPPGTFRTLAVRARSAAGR